MAPYTEGSVWDPDAGSGQLVAAPPPVPWRGGPATRLGNPAAPAAGDVARRPSHCPALLKPDGEAVGDPQRRGTRWFRAVVMATEGRFCEVLRAVS